MAVVGVADQYMILMAITLLLTILSLSYRKNMVLSALTAVAWFVSGLGHFAVGDPTSILTQALALFFVGLSLLFAVRTVVGVVGWMREKRWGTGMEF